VKISGKKTSKGKALGNIGETSGRFVRMADRLSKSPDRKRGQIRSNPADVRDSRSLKKWEERTILKPIPSPFPLFINLYLCHPTRKEGEKFCQERKEKGKKEVLLVFAGFQILGGGGFLDTL
jgi:hypothetical protein